MDKARDPTMFGRNAKVQPRHCKVSSQPSASTIYVSWDQFEDWDVQCDIGRTSRGSPQSIVIIFHRTVLWCCRTQILGATASRHQEYGHQMATRHHLGVVLLLVRHHRGGRQMVPQIPIWRGRPRCHEAKVQTRDPNHTPATPLPWSNYPHPRSHDPHPPPPPGEAPNTSRDTCARPCIPPTTTTPNISRSILETTKRCSATRRIFLSSPNFDPMFGWGGNRSFIVVDACKPPPAPSAPSPPPTPQLHH